MGGRLGGPFGHAVRRYAGDLQSMMKLPADEANHPLPLPHALRERQLPVECRRQLTRLRIVGAACVIAGRFARTSGPVEAARLADRMRHGARDVQEVRSRFAGIAQEAQVQPASQELGIGILVAR